MQFASTAELELPVERVACACEMLAPLAPLAEAILCAASPALEAAAAQTRGAKLMHRNATG